MAVGPGHIRGVDGVMPIESQSGHPKGLAAKCRGMSKRIPYSEMDNITLAILPPYLNGLVSNVIILLAGTE